MNRPSSAASKPPSSKFTRLAITHALMMGGDAAMVVSLADSFFFSVDLDAARTQVLLFLAISFAPFLFVAPLIGPMIDRVAGGRRLVIQIVAVARLVLLLLMARYIDGIALFPLVFASLVLQKTYVISKSSLVPSTVRNETELVEANSKLGLVSGLLGGLAVIPAAILLKTLGSGAALLYGAILFGGAFASARRLAPEVVAATAVGEQEAEDLHSPSLRLGAIAMTALRANVGFTFFHLAFWLRTFDNGTVLFGAAVGASGLATLTGNALAPRVRRMMREETMLASALIISAVAGIGLGVVGGPAAGIALAAVVNFVAALGRLGFESIVQRDAPEANQGRAFATFETRFQLSWAVAAFFAVAIQAPGAIGLILVGVGALGTLIHVRIRQQRPDDAPPIRSKRRRRRPPKGSARRTKGRKGARKKRPPTRRDPGTREPTRGPAPRSRSASERPRDR
ncbi:MAG: MFS transporter [Ilumatobacter sp.]|uniref:MFS transporter n=1 Tax=Ilumatobacter sp. TaxID=1967498 RepID=UPI003C764187